MTEKEIIQKERERLKAEGKSPADVLRLTTGIYREKLLKSLTDDSEGIEKENTALQADEILIPKKSAARKSRKSGSEQKKKNTVKSPVESEPDHCEMITAKSEPSVCPVESEIVETDVVYDDIIQFYADEYVETLDEIGLKNLYSIQGRVFSGMVKYISNHCSFNATKQNAYTLNEIWKTYTGLCYKYSQVPYISEFAILLDIHRDTIYSWLNGEGIGKEYCDKASCTVSDTVKRWINECKTARLKGAGAGNVGMIFLCKAVDGLVETSPQPMYNQVQLENNADMMGKLGLKLSDSLPALTASN